MGNIQSDTFNVEDHIQAPYKYAVSIITPSYKGEKHIHRLLESIKNQNFPYQLFEQVIVINGERDGTEGIVKSFIKENPEINIKIVYSEIANASNARNLAIKAACGKYSTFIDDDDYVSPNFIKELYKKAKENRIVFSRIRDIDDEGNVSNSAIYKQIKKEKGVVVKPFERISSFITFIACKLIPTRYLKEIEFNTDLSSGEDIVFFSKLIINHDFEFYALKESTGAIYYRLLRSNSVSRKNVQYQFNVVERLEVIDELNGLLNITDDVAKRNFIKHKIRAQTSFINAYLVENVHEYVKLFSKIKSLNFQYFDYRELTKNISKKLMISFSFSPFDDVSSISMSKRVIERGALVDVLQNNMSALRKEDKDLVHLTEDYLGNNMMVNAIATFGNWNHIRGFCKIGFQNLTRNLNKNERYEEIYSCSMYPASNYLALQFKLENPNVIWSAEFSDQLVYEYIGDVINSKIGDKDYIEEMNSLLSLMELPKDVSGSLFGLCEYLTFVFADKIIFISENQKKYITTKYKNEDLLSIIEDKSEIIPPTTLKPEIYHLKQSNYNIDENYINLAYFGSFYEKMCLEDLYSSITGLDEDYRGKLKIHFFIRNPKKFEKTTAIESVLENLEIHPNVNFLEFLNLTTKFDCLIINDQKTEEKMEINPFLPSKLNDYIGSGVDIWGICEDGSAMSTYDLEYMTFFNDQESSLKTLKKIIDDHQ